MMIRDHNEDKLCDKTNLMKVNSRAFPTKWMFTNYDVYTRTLVYLSKDSGDKKVFLVNKV